MGFIDRRDAQDAVTAKAAAANKVEDAAATARAAEARVSAFVAALRVQLPTSTVQGFWSDQLFPDHPSLPGGGKPSGYPPWVGAFATIDDLVVRPAVFGRAARQVTTLFGLGTRYRWVVDQKSSVVGRPDDAAWGPRDPTQSWGICLQTGVYRRLTSGWQGESYPGNFIAVLPLAGVNPESLAAALPPRSGPAFRDLLSWVHGEHPRSKAENLEWTHPRPIC